MRARLAAAAGLSLACNEPSRQCGGTAISLFFRWGVLRGVPSSCGRVLCNALYPCI
jgi:hypothetical protein